MLPDRQLKFIVGVLDVICNTVVGDLQWTRKHCQLTKGSRYGVAHSSSHRCLSCGQVKAWDADPQGSATSWAEQAAQLGNELPFP